MLKRAFDFTTALMGLLVLLPDAERLTRRARGAAWHDGLGAICSRRFG